MARGPLRRFAGSEGGAAAIEFAIIVWALLFVCLGVIEIGRGLHVRNEMSYAADLAARKILTFEAYSKSELSAASKESLESDVRDAFTGTKPETLVVDIENEPGANGDEFRAVLISYPFSFVIPGLGAPFDLKVSRRVPIG